MRAEQNDDNRWHLDKRVPIALIVTLLAQALAFGLWLGGIERAQREQERRLSLLEAQRISERLASVEAQLADVKALVLRIDARLERQGRAP